MADYDVFLLDDQFTRLAYLPGHHSVRFVKSANSVGAFEIEFPELDDSLLAVDRIVEIWRKTAELPPRRAFSGLLRKWPRKTLSDGARIISLVGTDWNGLLARRVVAYKANTPQADKHGPADDLMKTVVRENLGNLAEADRNLSDYGFSVQTDATAGPVVSKAVEWRTVLRALQQFSEEAGDDEVFFDVVHVGRDALEFQTWVGQRGLDRTTGAGVCYFGLEHGNLADPVLTYDHSRTSNYIYVGGKGEGEDLVVEEVEDEDRVGASIWNRCEAYERAPSDISDGGLQSVGEGALARYAPVRRIKASLLDTKAARWGRDWNFGDRVLVRSEGEYLSVVLRTMDVMLDTRGREIIKAVLDASTGEQGWDEGVPGLLYLIRSLRKKQDEPGPKDGFSLDFTGTLFDTVDKCHRVGLRFSDVDSPFPTVVTWNAPTGSWSHAAGRGWQPFSSTSAAGPAIVFPLAQGHEWELTMVVDYRDVALTTLSHVELAYMSNSGNTGAIAAMPSFNAAQKQVACNLYTNDGDDTYTTRYAGAVQSGADNYTLKFRNKNGTVGVWDPEDDDWHHFEGRGAAGQAYNAALGAIQVRQKSSTALDEIYIQSLKVRYLDRS